MAEKHSLFILILAGTAFFLYGSGLVSDNLQSLAANRIRDILSKLSKQPLLGVVAGIAVTIFMQSSGSVTTMLVGLGTAGIVTLPQVMGIILGTGLGSTITTQLLSLNIAELGLPFFGVGFTIHFLTERKVLKRVMAVVMGFGLMFWGLEVIGVGASALKETSLFLNSLSYLKSNPLSMVLLTALFTSVIHSSAAVVGIAMALASSGLMSVADGFYWVYGANIGTTATALMAAAGSNAVGKQVAVAHSLHKIIMVILCYYFTDHLASLISIGDPLRDVANAHLVFNFLGAILFLPFLNQAATWIEKIVPVGDKDKEFSVEYLDRVNFESPSVVFAHAERECLRMGDIVLSMIRDSLKVLRDDDPDLIDDLRARDNKVDLLNREISLYITKYMDSNEDKMHQQMVRLFSYVSDLESAADVVDNSILDLARKKHSFKIDFSKEGWDELDTMHKSIIEVAELSMSCFQTRSRELAEQILNKKRHIRSMEKDFRERHIDRLVQGRRETINTSSIHLDVLSDYRRIVGLMSNHVYALARKVDA